MNFKHKIVLFVVCLAALLALQSKVVMPFLYKVAASDLFLEDSSDAASDLPISNALTDLALKYCNAHIKSNTFANSNVSFSDRAINSWSLGNYHYVINAELENTPSNGASSIHRYVCRIHYVKGDDQTGINDIENWNIEGISGLPE